MSDEFRVAVSKIKRYEAALQDAVGEYLYQIGEEIMTDVKASGPGRGVPVDTGTLRNSLRVVRRDPTHVDLVAGGASAQYALVQHERTDYRHTVGEPRYLVRGAERWTPGGSAASNALKRNALFAAQRAAQGGY